jgi:hypothetical protein
MYMARDDIRHALRPAGAANDRDSPEFTYWIRIATGHFFEAEGRSVSGGAYPRSEPSSRPSPRTAARP